MHDHFLTVCDSRGSHMLPALVLIFLHADSIDGHRGTSCQWYFATVLKLENGGLIGSYNGGSRVREEEEGERPRYDEIAEDPLFTQLG